MAGFEYAGVTQDTKYATIWLNLSKLDDSMPEYVWICDNRYVTLQINEYLLQDGCIQNPAKDLR